MPNPFKEHEMKVSQSSHNKTEFQNFPENNPDDDWGFVENWEQKPVMQHSKNKEQEIKQTEKKNASGKLQSIVTQLDKNRDKLAQQTIDFKRLEQKMNDLIQDHKN